MRTACRCRGTVYSTSKLICKLYTVLHTVHCPLHCILCTVHCPVLSTVHCSVYSTLSIKLFTVVYTVLYCQLYTVLYTVHCPLNWSLSCILYTDLWTIHFPVYKTLSFKLYTVHCTLSLTLSSVHCTLSCTQLTDLYTVYCTGALQGSWASCSWRHKQYCLTDWDVRLVTIHYVTIHNTANYTIFASQQHCKSFNAKHQFYAGFCFSIWKRSVLLQCVFNYSLEFSCRVWS